MPILRSCERPCKASALITENLEICRKFPKRRPMTSRRSSLMSGGCNARRESIEESRLFVERVDQVGVGLSDSFDGMNFGEDQLG